MACVIERVASSYRIAEVSKWHIAALVEMGKETAETLADHVRLFADDPITPKPPRPSGTGARAAWRYSQRYAGPRRA
jgi:hypothetical protein